MFRLVLSLSRGHTDKKNLVSLSEKKFFKHYQTGINLSLENRLGQANVAFAQSLQEIKSTKEQELEHYSHILRRIANNHRRMGQMKEAEDKLYAVVKHKRAVGINPAILYDDYDVLFRHMLTYDLEKATKLCKALLAKEKQDMPIAHIKLFNFNLGNAYLLAGNHEDAKMRYSKCLEMQPQGKVKSYVYNNLGLACWWHKNPIQKARQAIPNQNVEKVEDDFRQAKGILGKSIEAAEDTLADVSETAKLLRNQTLNFKNGTLSNNAVFESEYSLHGLWNLAEFYLANDPINKAEIMFWLNKALNIAQKHKKEKAFDRILVQQSVLTNNLPTLNSLLPELITKYHQTQRFAQEMFYCALLSKITRDPAQAQQYADRCARYEQVLPAWTKKLKYLAMDELDLEHHG